MTFEPEVLARKRRVSLSIEEVLFLNGAMLVGGAQSPDNERVGGPLVAKLNQILDEESDPQFRATVDFYRAAVAVKDGEIEMDDDAEVSLGDDDGAYVMVWTWVSAKDAGLAPAEIICNRCGDRTNKGDSPDGDMCPDCYDECQNEDEK